MMLVFLLKTCFSDVGLCTVSMSTFFFSFFLCDTDPNMCERNPCQNEAVCVDGLRSYMCICQPGYYGDNCEKRKYFVFVFFVYFKQ